MRIEGNGIRPVAQFRNHGIRVLFEFQHLFGFHRPAIHDVLKGAAGIPAMSHPNLLVALVNAAFSDLAE